MQQGGSLPEKQELRTVELQCIANGHRFPREVWCWVHYLEGSDEPVFWKVIHTTGVRCPQCGSPANEAKG